MIDQLVDLLLSLAVLYLAGAVWRLQNPRRESLKPPAEPPIEIPANRQANPRSKVVRARPRHTAPVLALVLAELVWPCVGAAQVRAQVRVPSNCTDDQVIGGQADGSGVECQADAVGSPAGSGSELQYRVDGSTFGAVTGSSSASGGIALVNQSAAATPLIVQGAASQSGDLLKLRNSSGTDQLAVGSTGALHMPAVANRISQSSNCFVFHHDNTLTHRWCWNGENVINEPGFGGAHFRVEGDTDANLLFTNAATDRVGIGTSSPTEKFDVNSDTIRVRTAKTPASATATCDQGEIVWDANFVYVCVATNTWKRAGLSTW